MIYSPYCIDPTEGFIIQSDGSMKPRKLGYMVMTLEEAEKCLQHRRDNGEFD